MRNRLVLAVFPIVHAILLLGALFSVSSNMILACVLGILAALAMCFSLHITIHYHVHHKPQNNFLKRSLDLIYTSMLGMPFHTYQLQHFMHHKYDNKPGDVTSTFKEVDGKLEAKSWFSYSFFWFLQGGSFKEFIENCRKEGFYTSSVKSKSRVESLVNLVVICLLVYLNWKFAIVYILVVYLGWSFIALHNYGQHLPKVNEYKKGYSFYAKWYNYLSMNNGLHAEHHEKPAIKYWDLKEDRSKAGINSLPHIIEPLTFSPQNSQV